MLSSYYYRTWPTLPISLRLVAALTIIVMLFWLAGCACSDGGSSGPDPKTEGGGKTDDPSADDNLVEVVILHTTDEHGWLQPQVDADTGVVKGGAANVLGLWLRDEHYQPDTHLVLSGGDNWSGPALATWYQGEPVVQALNLMGYDAAVVGNHEFDFGVEVLTERIAEADYPYLSANMQYIDSSSVPPFVEPHVIIPAGGVQVGVIGLTTTDTKTDSHPRLVADLQFVDYVETLESEVPLVRAEGAEIVVVLAHECCPALAEMAEMLTVQVDVMFGAHCHRKSKKLVNDIPILCSGWAFKDYGRVSLQYNRESRQVESYEMSTLPVKFEPGDEEVADPELQSLIDDWQERADEDLGGPVGYSATGIYKASWAMGNWVTDSWLWAFPDADIAVEIFGGLRQAIPEGSFTLGDMVGMLPFENTIYQIQLTGSQLAENLAYAVDECHPRTTCYPAVGGIRYVKTEEGLQITFLDGRPFEADAPYIVLVNDFIYWGGVGYFFAVQDPVPLETGVSTRQPVIDWTMQLQTSPSDPLENYLDFTGRDR